MQGKLPMKARYSVKSPLTRPQTLTAVKVSKQQPPPPPPQPCAFDTQLRTRTVPGLFGKAGLDGKPPPFWEATMAWTRATPVLKRKRQQLPFSEFAQIYIYTPVFKNVAISKYIWYIYAFCFLIRKVRHEACVFHAEGTMRFSFNKNSIQKLTRKIPQAIWGKWNSI